jgi:hypothetical protein
MCGRRRCAYRRGLDRQLEHFLVLRRRGFEAQFGMLLQYRQSILGHWRIHALGKLFQSCISGGTLYARQQYPMA